MEAWGEGEMGDGREGGEVSATTLGRIPVVDPQPYSPCSLTFEAQNSVTNVAETAVIDHGSHNIDTPIKDH